MKIGLTLGAFGGLALAGALFIYYGFAPIVAACAATGWGGLTAICAVHLVSVVLCALAWRLLLVPAPAGAFSALLWARWLRDSTGNLLAILPAAGELIAARELTFHGIARSLAGATTIIDLTIEMLSQLIFTLLGLALLLVQRPGFDSAWWTAVALVAAATAVVGFIAAQRHGLFRLLQKLATRLGLRQPFQGLVDAARIDAAIQEIYQQRLRVAGSLVLHLAAWVAGAAETWLALRLLGYPLSFADALLMESLVFALRTAAFAIPSGLGVQEGGYLMLGALLGLRPDVSLALALLKRAREIIFAVPAVLIWQAIESRRLWLDLGSWRQPESAEVGEPRS